MHSYVHSSTISYSQDMEATYMPIGKRMDKEDVCVCVCLYIYINGMLLSHKQWNSVICSSVDGLEIITLTEVSQKDKDTIRYHFYVKSKIGHKWIYLQNRNRLTDVENRLMVAKGEGGGIRRLRVGIHRCKLLYIDWINNKVLLCSTGNYIQ